MAAADSGSSSGAGSEGAKDALFAELSKIDQSSGRTAGLRHVTKEMKSTGASSTVPASGASSASSSASGASKAASEKPKRAASKRKAGMRWVVENFSKDDGPVTVDGVAIKEEVYIGGCINAVIIIPDKCKAIAIDGCKKTQILFEGAVSSCEVINCRGVKMQCKSTCPTISIDKVDGITVYLSYAGRDTQFITSKSSEMNICFPETDSEDAEFKEVPIPEQFIAKIKPDNSLDVSVSDLYSG